MLFFSQAAECVSDFLCNDDDDAVLWRWHCESGNDEDADADSDAAAFAANDAGYNDDAVLATCGSK